jgi:hypothetical protein
VLGAHAWRPSPSPQPPSAPPLGAREGEALPHLPPGPPSAPPWGLKRKNAGNCSRNGCVLGARTSGPHLDGWNRGALVAAPVLGAHAWRPSPSPQPPSSPPLGARKGEGAASPSPRPFRSPTGRGRGRALPPLPPAPFSSSMGGGRERTPEIAHAMVACWERGPLARILMDGTGGHWLQRRCWERTPGGPPLPPAPFLSPAGGEEGGGTASPSPWPLHRFARRSACSFPPLSYADDTIDERSVAWGDR